MKAAARKKNRVRQKQVTLASLDAKFDSKFDALDTKIDRVIDAIALLPTRKEFNELEERVADLGRSIEKLVTSIDALTKSVGDVKLEYLVIKRQMERYDRWFQEIAKKTGIELKP